MRGQYFDEQPDCGNNRHYDYITVKEHDAAEKSLKTKTSWRDLTTHEIVVLRSKCKDLGLNPDVADHLDRLALLRCIFSHCENRNEWMRKAIELGKLK